MYFSLKLWLHIIGSALGLFGVVFVFIQLYTYSEQIDFARFHANTWGLIVSLAIMYGAANLMLVQAWWLLLSFFGITVERRWALQAFGVAQLAKYVPGNILHLAGRQALGMAADLPPLPLAKSVMWELGLFACAGAFFGALMTALTWTGLPAIILVSVFLVIALGVITLLNLCLASAVGYAFAWQICFLTVSSFVFIGTLALLDPLSITFSTCLTLSAAYVIAWLAGLVTPGAPAGVGVREFVLLFLLNGMFIESDLLLAVILGRIITVLGDFLFFLYAYFLRHKPVSA